MNDIKKLFDSIPLPYKYCLIPEPDEPDLVRLKKRYYCVNHVITNVTRCAFKHAGFISTKSKTKWNASWGKQYDNSQYGTCACWQKVNHFAGAFLIGRKDQLHKRMMELRSRDHSLASFYPKSFLLPDDYSKLQHIWKKKELWIVKPVASSRGRGIYVVSSKEKKTPQSNGKIVQYYISKPLLITRRKFDIRLYALVTSVTPIRIYMHTKSGLARFATHEYNMDVDGSSQDKHMHLTNFAINKGDELFVKCSEINKNSKVEERIENSKWSLSFLLDYLEKNYNVKNLFEELERVTATTILTGMAEVRSYHSRYVVHRHTCYELYGIDIILDETFKPYVMEVNISPSLNGTNSTLDFQLKYPLMLDVLRMARIIDCPPKKEFPCQGLSLVERECRLSMAKGRLSEIELNKSFDGSNKNNKSPWDNPVFADYVMVRDFIEEKNIKSDFKRIYPKRKNYDEFEKCYSAKRYHDIVFGEWIKMSNENRLKVLKQHLNVYKNKMDEINNNLCSSVSKK